MKLLVDIGNSAIKWAIYSQTLEPHESRYEAESFSSLLSVMWSDLPAPTEVYVANVAGSERAKEISYWIQKIWNAKTHFIYSKTQELGISNAYLSPEKLGVDRWLAMIAAHNTFKKNICLFDCGTAITADVVTKEGKHLGGLIFPGLHLLQKSLIENTAGISAIHPREYLSFDGMLANTTEKAVYQACLLGAVSFIDGVAERTRKQLGPDVALLLTGGYGKLLLPSLSLDYHYIPDLVLHGLAMIASEK